MSARTRCEDCALCPEPHDGWPHFPFGELCQMCWEAECSKSYWAAIDAGMCTDVERQMRLQRDSALPVAAREGL